MSMDMDLKNEKDFKLDRGKVRTAGADWMWVMMTFQRDTSQTTGIMKTWFRFIIILL